MRKTITCQYCGRYNRIGSLVCGEGQTWGCGAALPKTAPLLDLEVDSCRTVGTEQAGQVGFYVTGERCVIEDCRSYRSTFAGRMDELRNMIDDACVEFGRLFMPLFERLL